MRARTRQPTHRRVRNHTKSQYTSMRAPMSRRTVLTMLRHADLQSLRSKLRDQRDRGEITVDPPVCSSCGWDEASGALRKATRGSWYTPVKRLTPDLDDDGETIYGWLCWHCARLVATAKKYPELIARVAAYVERRGT